MNKEKENSTSTKKKNNVNKNVNNSTSNKNKNMSKKPAHTSNVKEANKKNENKKSDNKKYENKKIVEQKKEKEEVLETKETKETKIEEKKETKKKGNFFKFIINNRFTIIAFVLGILIGLGIMSTMIPEQIAQLKDGSESIAVFGDDGLSTSELYNSLKQDAEISKILDLIDAKLLEKDYPYETYNKKAKEQAAEYIEFYKTNYNLSESDFLSYYGFTDVEKFIEFLTLDTQRYDYYHDVLKGKISEKDKKNYYKKSVFGPIGSRYISVEKDDEKKDDEALIKEIQDKINNGKSYEDIVEEYKSNTSVKSADLGYITFDGGMEEKYIEALKKLKDNSHSTKYIETETYGYTIIFRTDQKEKEEYEKVDSVIEELLIQKLDSEDSNLFYKTFIKFRKDAGLKFTDTVYKKAYDEYVKKYK